MSKKTLKIISILAIILCVIMVVTPVFATDPDPDATQQGTGTVNIDNLTAKNDANATTAIEGFGGKVIGLISNIGIVASVIILMLIGLKYLTGSVEEKAEYKKSLIPYVVGVVVLFGASAIAKFIIGFANI